MGDDFEVGLLDAYPTGKSCQGVEIAGVSGRPQAAFATQARGTVVDMREDRWQRGQSRLRLTAATLAAVADGGPQSVSGRQIAKDADVYHAQIQQMFGSVNELVSYTIFAERDRFVAEVFTDDGALPSPLLVADFPLFWRATAQVLLDPGPVDLAQLAVGGPIGLLASRLHDQSPDRGEVLDAAIASSWAAAPLGALIFRGPLQQGLGIAPDDWPHCWERLGDRIASLATVEELPSVPVGQARRSPEARDQATRGREQLLEAAETLLATRLETSVTGRELAATAGVNYGLVSHYFGSKTAVFDEALSNLHRAFLHDVLVPNHSDQPAGSLAVFARHRAFLRAWASRLLRQAATPEFELRGMEELMERVSRSRGINPHQRIRRLDAAGDAMASVALQLGWTILRPLPEAVSAQTLAELELVLRSVHRWILEEPSG